MGHIDDGIDFLGNHLDSGVDVLDLRHLDHGLLRDVNMLDHQRYKRNHKHGQHTKGPKEISDESAGLQIKGPAPRQLGTEWPVSQATPLAWPTEQGY